MNDRGEYIKLTEPDPDILKDIKRIAVEKEVTIINNISNELDKKRKITINKNDKDLLRDQIESYRLEETTLDYILYIILEFAGKLI